MIFIVLKKISRRSPAYFLPLHYIFFKAIESVKMRPEPFQVIGNYLL